MKQENEEQPYERDKTTDQKQDPHDFEAFLNSDAAEQLANDHQQEDYFAQQEQETDEEEGSYRSISTAVFEQLPELLRTPCMRFKDEEERELFLVGALGIISGMLPNYRGNYFGNEMGTNLYCFVIGRYGVGKGSLKWAQRLGDGVHQYKVKQAKEQVRQYKQAKQDYSIQMALYNKGKREDAPKEPLEPKHLKLFIPANTTKTAVMQLLEENDGSGIIFETEGDTLADMLRQEYGNFSDILRKAFHHETISFFRRANNEDVSVQHPALSVVLSGTYDQLLKLIPSIDNGLYSRFIYYNVEGNADFKNPFEHTDFTHAYHLTQYAKQYLGLYQALEQRNAPLSFFLTEKQQHKFVAHFKYVKEWTQDNISDDLDGSVNRMGLMTFRIAMILTILRQYKQNTKLNPISLTCHDDDLDSAIEIMDVLSYNATDVYHYLKKYGYNKSTAAIREVTDAHKNLCWRLSKQGLSNRKIAIEVFGNENSRGKVKRILKDFGIAR